MAKVTVPEWSEVRSFTVDIYFSFLFVHILLLRQHKFGQSGTTPPTLKIQHGYRTDTERIQRRHDGYTYYCGDRTDTDRMVGHVISHMVSEIT